MKTWWIRGVVPWLAVGLLAAGPALAQETSPPVTEPVQPPTTEALQRQIDQLTQQLQAMQKQLEALMAQQEVHKEQSELDHLRQAAAAEAAAEAPAEAVDTGTEFVSGTRMQPELNPEISVNGDIFFVAGDNLKNQMQARHFELDFQSYLDPFTKMHVVFGYEGGHSDWGYGEDEHVEGEHEEEHGGFGLEEGYLTWLNLPGNTMLTVGKKRQQFGTLNRWHMHALPQTDYPWVIQESFGTHGLSGTGVSVEWMMPVLWADANELVVEVMDGNNDVAFAGSDWTQPSYLVFLKSYWDLSPNTYLEADVTGLLGVTDSDGDLAHDFFAIDLVYDWYPLGRELYRGFQARGMLLRSWLDLDDGSSLDTWGSYLYGQYKFARRWIAGVRWDWVQDQRHEGHEFWGLSPYLTFWQSEYVRLRGQYSYRSHNTYGTDNRFELQFTFAAGPHKHESY
ncbi:MAG: hypothetical protein QNL88_06050 [Acidobacteriota bacterium]|nr:hypothetical protein [Acidobacteriota bacterium]